MSIPHLILVVVIIMADNVENLIAKTEARQEIVSLQLAKAQRLLNKNQKATQETNMRLASSKECLKESHHLLALPLLSNPLIPD